MRGMILLAQISVVAGLLGGVLWWVKDYTEAKHAVSELSARQEQAGEVSRILGAALAQSRGRALSYRAAFEELANVQDDEVCRSPAIDRAFDIVRRRRAGSGN